MKQKCLRLCLLLIATTSAAVLAADAGYAAHGMTNATPSQVYLRYVQVLDELTSLQQLLPFSNRKQAANMEQLASMSPEQRQKTAEVLRNGAPQDVTVVAKQVQGDQASLQVTAHMHGPFESDLQPVWGTITRCPVTGILSHSARLRAPVARRGAPARAIPLPSAATQSTGARSLAHICI